MQTKTIDMLLNCNQQLHQFQECNSDVEIKMPVVVIANGQPELLRSLVGRCRKSGLDPYVATTAIQALDELRQRNADLLILDIDMSAGMGIYDLISNDEEMVGLRVIVVGNDIEEMQPKHSCADRIRFLQKELLAWPDVLGHIEELLDWDSPHRKVSAKSIDGEAGATRESRPTVLCIDDDPDITLAIKLRLEKLGINVARAFSGMEGYWSAVQLRPEAIVCDLNMPDGEGQYINGRLKSHPLTRDIPVIMLTGQGSKFLQRELFGLGVVSYLQKPLDFELLVKTLKQHIPFAPSLPGQSMTSVLVPS